MTRMNHLLAAPPFPVEHSLRNLGENLRTARMRRNMRIIDVAERIGTGPRAVMDAEKGKPSTSIAVYTALLWLYGMLYHMDEVGDPTGDREGLAFASFSERQRARKGKGLDNDF